VIPPCRRIVLVVLLMVFAVGMARPTLAAPLAADIYVDLLYGRLFIDARPGGVATGINDLGPQRFANIGGFPTLEGLLTFTTGEFIRTEVNGFNGQGQGYDYRFGRGGTMSAWFVLGLPDGSTHQGTFDAVLGETVITADDDSGDFPAPIHRGRFDRATAVLLGMPATHLGGRFGFALDFNDNDFGSDVRVAASYDIINIEAPEPALLALLPIGLGLALARRRSARRATPTQGR
jgi:hypothetical protein